MELVLISIGWIISCLVSSSLGRIFEPCDLADELLRLGAPQQQISTWVCIAEHESSFNTSAVGPRNWDGSRDHGIFQINDRYWCSPPGSACGVDCRSLENEDIADDWKCAKRIFKATRLQEGDGFRAWAVYGPHCSGDTDVYTKGCKMRSTYTGQPAAYAHLVTSHADPLQFHYGLPSYGSRPVYGLPSYGSRPVYGLPSYGSRPVYGLPSYGSRPVYSLSLYSAHLAHPTWYSSNFDNTNQLYWGR